ncbi:alpha/beta fold hydrolase [Changchengzhania lutea]|uniref:alpha/beta fold hydrolase n=1 Tax=Changchengzhania lutea TaxID=2049305 RepID=UPI00115C702B|nr:alpha/beta hydrolase [Changchengzhania lutea]
MNKYLPKILGFILNLISLVSKSYAAKLAIKISSTPRKGKLDSNADKFLKKAVQEFVFHEDIPIMTYHWKGIKDTVLLVHGWESNAYRWKRLIKMLQVNDYDVIALDAPAHGNSGSKLFNAVFYSECIHTVANRFKASVIIGHSVGGTATIFAHYKYKIPTLKKLVILGAPSDVVGIFERYRKMMGYNERIKQGMDDYVLKHYNHPPEYYSAADFSQSIETEGLIIHDELDMVIPYMDALKIEYKYANSKLISTTGYGHSLKSNTVNNHIIEFLNA